MSMKPSIVSEAELAKNSVISSPLDDDTKRNLVTLITKSAMATNGITQEEKVQALTECMASLASALGMYMSKSDQRLIKIEEKVEKAHPTSRIEEIQRAEALLSDVEKYRNLNGITANVCIGGKTLESYVKDLSAHNDTQDEHIKQLENDDGKTEESPTDDSIVKQIISILKIPYVWIFASIAVCSPYAAEVISTIIACFK